MTKENRKDCAENPPTLKMTTQSLSVDQFKEDPFEPDIILPCRLSEDQYLSTVYKFLVHLDRDFPDDLLIQLDCSQIAVQYEPAYYFEGEYVVSWSAKFGYEEKKEKKVYNRQNQRWQTKKEYFTRWESESGIVDGDYWAVKSASRTTFSSTVNTLSPVIEQTTLNEAFSDRSLMMPIKRHNEDLLTQTEVFNKISPSIDKKIEKEVRSNAKGKKAKDWKWKARFVNQKVLNVYIPLIFCFCRYSDQTFTIVINAACPDVVEVEGLPTDQRKTEQRDNHHSFIMIDTLLAVFIFIVGLNSNEIVSVGAALIWIFSLWWSFSEIRKAKDRSQERKKAFQKKIESKESDEEVMIPESYVIQYKKAILTILCLYALCAIPAFSVSAPI